MRAGVGAGSQFGRRSCPYRFGQVFYRPRCGDRGPYNEALRLSPRDIYAFRWLLYVGFAKLQLDADAEAVAWFRRSIEANRNYPLTHFGLAAALALLGSLDEARAAAKAGLALDPSFTIRRFRVGASSDNPTYLAGRERICRGHAHGRGAGGVMSENGMDRPCSRPEPLRE